MYELNYVRKKIIGRLFFNILLISVCLINVIINMDTYKMVLSNNFTQIKSINDLDSNNKFMYIDLKDATLEHYSIVTKNNNFNIYTYKLNGINVLVLLKENTIITNKTPVEIINNNDMILDIKDKLKDNDYYEIVLSNINYNNNRKIELYKIYILLFIIFITIISIFIDLIGIIWPKHTHLYKKIVKKGI